MEFVEESGEINDAESCEMNDEQRGWCPFLIAKVITTEEPAINASFRLSVQIRFLCLSD